MGMFKAFPLILDSCLIPCRLPLTALLAFFYNEPMPELPEVETVASSVDAHVRGERIVDVWFTSHPQPFKTPPSLQAEALTGRRFLSVHRTGKHIVCELGSKTKKSSSHEVQPEAEWIVHLGMTGQLLVTQPDDPVAPHTHARLTLSSGHELRFIDPRRFGRLEFRDLGQSAAFCAPGAEPLTIGAKDFARLFQGRRLAIKAALLNQSLLSGVGNIYADESLFHAGIHPLRQTGRLKAAELEALRKALRKVLRHAIRLGGSSISDYVDANGEKGFFQFEHCVYQRTGKPCVHCQTPIRRVVVAGRGTHYCPKCQK
jgi:formamidopyrimidine-DNA glycosylase